ncbi:hypothetical protein H2203_005171 [Taxawa tesnikishii (nom. ined.)]|nr:hypothetical protein H2203_005171 [Dothideales sp. JES 119]
MEEQGPVASSSLENIVTILVTGFGSFQGEHPINPSSYITLNLPSRLAKDPSSSTAVRVLIHPYPIRVSYEEVRDLIPNICSGYDADIILHIGMAAGRDYYAIERLAHRDGYTVLKDVDGKVLSSSDGAEYWPDCPPELETSLPFDDIWRRWKENATNTPSLCDADIRPSTHAGHYLCDFLYYCCLADNQRRKRDNKAIAEVDKRPVIFLQPIEGASGQLCGREEIRGVSGAISSRLA